MSSPALGSVAINMLCHNSPGAPNNRLSVPFEYKQMAPGGIGQASSHRVQFNVNKEAVKGTILVNSKNDGICIAAITSDHIVKDASYVFIPEGSFTQGLGEKPSGINESVSVSWSKTSNKEVTFVVRSAGDKVGNVTLVFFINYELAI